MTALADARAVVGLWYAGRRDQTDLIDMACDLLVAGYDGEALCMLAGVSTRDPGDEVTQLLPDALREVGISYHERNSAEAETIALIAMAGELLRGAITPRALASWAWGNYDYHDDRAHTLAELDNFYDCVDQANEDVDAQVTAEARRLAALAW